MIEYNNIVKQYNDLMNIMSKCHSVEDARSIANGYGLSIEIAEKDDGKVEDCYNSYFDDMSNDKIEWFRVENFEDLEYIYIYTDNFPTRFDVYEYDEPIIDDTTIDRLEQDLYEYYKYKKSEKIL